MTGTLSLTPFRLHARVQEAVGIVGLDLRPVDGGAVPSFEAGAHIDVEAAPGIVRQYSLCNKPGELHRYRIAVLDDPRSRGGSRALNELAEVGRSVRVGDPRNNFSLASDGRSARLFAGGIGITPILAMAEQLHAEGKPFRLYYAGRSRASMAFEAYLRACPFRASVELHVDDEAGLLFDAGSRVRAPADGEHLYVCGPEVFIRAVLDEAGGEWPETRLHRERFSAPEPSADGNRPFRVRAGIDGPDLLVPADRSALAVLLDHGFDIPASCEQGLCGSCLTKVLAGEPDHRDQFQTEAEKARNDAIALCCSRSKSARLVLDIRRRD